VAKQKWKLPALDSEELAHISPDLRPLAVPIDSIYPDPDNVRLHPERNFNATASSLAKYGQRKPIVVNERTRTVEAGNGTLECARELGWGWIAISREDDDHVTAAGFAIADNRTAELATWDYEALSMQLKSLGDEEVDVAGLGFNEDELAALSEQFAAPPPATNPDEIGGYDPNSDVYQIRVDGVKPDEKEAVLERLNEVLADYEHLQAQAY